MRYVVAIVLAIVAVLFILIVLVFIGLGVALFGNPRNPVPGPVAPRQAVANDNAPAMEIRSWEDFHAHLMYQMLLGMLNSDDPAWKAFHFQDVCEASLFLGVHQQSDFFASFEPIDELSLVIIRPGEPKEPKTIELGLPDQSPAFRFTKINGPVDKPIAFVSKSRFANQALRQENLFAIYEQDRWIFKSPRVIVENPKQEVKP